jgi:hypothetical protein
MAKPKRPKLTVKSKVSRLPSDNTSSYTSDHKYVQDRPYDPMTMLDPTGVSNYPELMSAVEEGRYKDVPMEMLGSLPMVGKFGKALGAFKTRRGVPLGKFLPLLDDANEMIEYKKGGYVPQYMNGSTVGSIVGAGVGALGFMGGPAVGIATMSLGSSLGQRVGSEYDKNNMPQEPMMQQYQPTMFNMDRGSNNNFYPYGGMTAPNAEVELNEVAKTPDGQTIMFDGPSHEQGGIQTALPPGTQITSDRLINPMTGNTFAKDQASLERRKGALTRKLKDRPNDKYIKNSIDVLDKESDKIFQLQEQLKGPQMPQQMFAGGGTVYSKAMKSLSPQQLAQMDAEYTKNLNAGNKSFKSSVTGLNYKVSPTQKRVYAKDLYKAETGKTPTESQTKQVIKALDKSNGWSTTPPQSTTPKVNTPQQGGPWPQKPWQNPNREVVIKGDRINKPAPTNVEKLKLKTEAQQPGGPWPQKAWANPNREVVVTGERKRPTVNRPGANIQNNPSDNTNAVQMNISPSKGSKKSFNQNAFGLAQSNNVPMDVTGRMQEAYTNAKNFANELTTPTGKVPDVTAGPRMTFNSLQNIDSKLPSPAKMLAGDLMGNSKTKKWTAKDFSQDEQDYLKMMIEGVNKKTGRKNVIYSDYDNKKGTVEPFLDQINPFSDNSRLKYSLGQFNFDMTDDSIFVKDTYDFNDRNDSGYVYNVGRRMDKGDNPGYASVRAMGTTWGSRDGEGAPVDIRIPRKAMGGYIKQYAWGDTIQSDPRMQQLNWGYNPLQNEPIESTRDIQVPFTSNGKQYIVPSVSAGNPLNQSFETGQDVANVSQPNMLSSTPSSGPNYSNIGLGLGIANTALQIGQSFFPDKIDRISNPNAQRGMNTYSDAIRRQRNLRYNVNDQLNDINSSELAGNRYISNNVSSGNVRAGNMLANRALSMNARNQVYGDRNRMQTGFQSEANKMQMGYADYINQLGMQQAGFDQNYRDTNLQQRANLRGIRSQALGNLSDTAQGYGRDQQLTEMLPYMFPNANPEIWRRR